MISDVIVMAAGDGTRLLPVTQRWPKPVLPIDGRPVLATLLRELALAGLERVWLVTGHLAEQVERLAGDGRAFGLDVRPVRQHPLDGSAGAVGRALEAGAPATCLLSAADTVYTAGAVGRFRSAFADSDAAGAIAVRPPPLLPRQTRVRVDDGRIVRVPDPAGTRSAAPLMAFRAPVARELEAVCRPPFSPPYEVAAAYQRAIDGGERIAAIETGPTRDLTNPLDLVEENFSYLRGLSG